MYICFTPLLLILGTGVTTVAAGALSKSQEYKHKTHCPPFSGTFNIDQYQLYPENADFDFVQCLLYIGSLFNASVAVYDPYEARIMEILTFPNITHNHAMHIGGVGVDSRTGLLSIVADAADAFQLPFGQNVSGTNYIIQYDPRSKQVLYQLNLTETTRGDYGGFQDVEQDPRGNVYVVGTNPASILKVDRKGKSVIPWYVSQPIITTRVGYGGLAALGDLLLANDINTAGLVRFDMCAEKGSPVVVPLTPANATLPVSDAIMLPRRYNGTVLLVAENYGGVAVLRSQDAMWRTAEYLGVVVDQNNATNALNGILVTAPVEIGQSLYMIKEFFLDPPVDGSSAENGTQAGNRTQFPFVDITYQVETLLNK